MSRSLSSTLSRRRRRPVAALMALVLVAAVAACDGTPPPENPPFWYPGTTVDATVHGPLVRIQWDAPTGGDPVAAYQINLGAYNGTGVALVPSSVRDCYITGLAASTTYTIYVTARDAQNHWSGPLSGTKGNRKTTVTTSSHGGAGPNLWCHTATDTDGDGLPDALETDDGTYNNAADTGTDPADPDTDDDGIPDGTEALGRPGLDLIAMGASPTFKDLLIETDWISHAPCAIQPTLSGLGPMRTAFVFAPVDNPSGYPGINLIIDYGQGGLFTGGNQIPDPDGTLDGRFTGQNVNGTHFVAAKATHFASVRKDIFHYSVFHGGLSSTAETGGDDTYVAGRCGDPDPLGLASVLMHEIGHNLGLSHGGSTDLPVPPNPDGSGRYCDDSGEFPFPCVERYNINWKPNYVSVMNYMYRKGVDDSCLDNNYAPHVSQFGPLRVDYSSGTRATLDENALDETVGICNGVDFDFNDNGIIDPAPYSANITEDAQYRTILTPLHDHDDWGYIERVGLTKFVGHMD